MTLSTTLPATSVVPEEANTEDRRSLRSKKMLRDACAKLIEERGIDGFSISDLTNAADLNRGTFYAHYKDKDDLLKSFEAEIFVSLQTIEQRIKNILLEELFVSLSMGQPLSFCVELFDILREHGMLLRALLGPGGDATFQARLRDIVCTNMVQAVLYPKYRENPTPLVEYYIAYYAAAHLGLIQCWLERGMVETSEEMAHIMTSVVFLKPGDRIELLGQI